jgi:hypothetical protein
MLLMLIVWMPGMALAGPAAHFQPQAFLAGSCWKGTFADGKRTDEHCFEWIYGGQFLRDRHTVTGRPAPYGGETIYYFDAPSRPNSPTSTNVPANRCCNWPRSCATAAPPSTANCGRC